MKQNPIDVTTKVIDGGIVTANSATPIILDVQSALVFAANVGHESNCYNIAVNKAAIAEEFIDISTGIAGEVVQKFVNNIFKLAIKGDFSGYASKSLHDYIYECKRNLLGVINWESTGYNESGGGIFVNR